MRRQARDVRTSSDKKRAGFSGRGRVASTLPLDALARKLLGRVSPAWRRKRVWSQVALVVVGESLGQAADVVLAVSECPVAGGDDAGPPKSRKSLHRSAVSRHRLRGVAEVLAAVASVHRVKMLAKLLEGPATYRALQKVTGLKAGPLYHHVAQLRLAGLIGPKQRDLYDLTRGGRNVALAVMTLPRLARDRRPRPQPL